MFTLKHDGKYVKLCALVMTHFTKRTYEFSFDCGQEWWAELLYDAIKQAMWSLAEGIRREAYEQGWNDHKKHNVKRESFQCTL